MESLICVHAEYPSFLLTLITVVPSFEVEKKFDVREKSWDLESDDLGFGICCSVIHPPSAHLT